MPSDGFASRVSLGSRGGRVAAGTFVALLAAAALLPSQGGRHEAGGAPSSGSALPTSTVSAVPSGAATPSGRSPADPSGSADPVGGAPEWAVVADASGLAGLGAPVGIAGGKDGIVATGSTGVAWSADGSSWQVVVGGPVGTPVVTTDGGYFALGDGVAWSSADGRSWTTVEAREAIGFHVHAIVAVGWTLVAVGTLSGSGDQTWGAVFTSVDGWTWRREAGMFPPYDGLAVSNGVVVATAKVQDEGRQVAVRRPDGTWSPLQRLAPQAEILAVAACGADGFVAVGTDLQGGRPLPMVWSSSDGTAWHLAGDATRIAGTPTAIADNAGFLLVSTRDPTGFWAWRAGTPWTAAREVPSFTVGTPTVMATVRGRVLALGEPIADAGTVAWSSPAFHPEPAIAGGDPTRGWTRAGSLPVTSDGDRLVGLPDGSLLLLGGVHPQEGGGIDTLIGVWRRDAEGRWTERSPMPAPRAGFRSAVAADGRVWVVGGVIADVDGLPSRRVDIYDPVRDRWAKGPDLPPEVYPEDAVAMPDGAVIAITSSTDFWRVRADDTRWRHVGTADPEANGTTAALLRDGRLLVIATTTVWEPDPTTPGGTDGRFVLRATTIDPSTGRSAVLAAPTAGGATSGTLIRLGDGRVVFALQQRALFGAGGGQLLRRVDVYDPADGSWSLLTQMPAGRINAAVASDPTGRLWVAGGETEYQDVGLYLPTDALLVWTPPASLRPGP